MRAEDVAAAAKGASLIVHAVNPPNYANWGFNRRREKFTPLKDVAGMLRSLTYAESAVELEGAAAGDRASPSRKAFLEGYAQATASSDFLPAGVAFDAVLGAFELERTVYELRYELHSRPDWVPIPVHSLRQMGKAA